MRSMIAREKIDPTESKTLIESKLDSIFYESILEQHKKNSSLNMNEFFIEKL